MGLNTTIQLVIEETKLSPGQEWRNERAAWRFVRVACGAAYWSTRPKPRALVEGETVVVWPSLKASILASQINHVVLHDFTFAPEWLCGFLTLPERRFFERGAGEAENSVSFLPTTHPCTQQFAALIAQQKSANMLVQRANVLSLATSFFAERLGRTEAPPNRHTFPHERFEQLICTMPDVELVLHGPDELAQFCGCTTRHFNRLFRKRFGESPVARQTELRLLRACQLLMETNKQISHIALESGYQSLSLFNRLFKRRFGMRPSEWREKNGGTQAPTHMGHSDKNCHQFDTVAPSNANLLMV